MGDRYVPEKKGSTLKEHTADIWLISEGDSLEHMFSAAVSGLYRLMANEFITGKVEKRTESFSANQVEEVLIDILSEALYLFDAESRLILEPSFTIERMNGRIDVKMDYVSKKAEIPEGAGGMEVKAPTYHGAELEEKNGNYKCKILLDV